MSYPCVGWRGVRCSMSSIRCDVLESRRLLATITGQAFSDFNGNGLVDGGEPVHPGVSVFLDQNNNGTLDGGEQSAVTDASGNYSFSPATFGTYVVAETLPAGFSQTKPGNAGTVIVSPNINISQRTGNQSEGAIALDPTNPNRLFMVSQVDSG